MEKWRAMLVLVLLAWATENRADLMLSGHSVTGAFGMPLSSQEQIWIQKTSVRRDFTDRGRAYTHLFDLARKQAIIVDHLMRVAEVHDLAVLGATTEASAPVEELKMKFEPTGNVMALQEWTCKEHELIASMPAKLGTEETIFHLKGKIWVASGVPEQAAVKDLVNATKKADFFLAIPALANITPAHSRIMNEIIRKLAPKGLPCACEVEASYEGNGPMANLARKMPSKASLAIQRFSTEPIKPEMFAIPANYRQVQGRQPAIGVK